MSVILTILAALGIAIAALLGLLLLLLAIALLCKLQYKVKVTKPGENADWDYDIRIKWLFGIIRRKIKSDEVNKTSDAEANAGAAVGAATSRPPKLTKDEKKKKKKDKKTDEKSGTKNKRLQALKSLDLETGIRIVGYTLSLLKKLFAVFYPKRIVIRGRYGAENPAITGKVLAAVYAAAAALSIRADVEGDFENEVLTLDIRAMGYFRLWAIAIPAVRYILRPEIWRLIFPKKAKKKKVKKETNTNPD